MKPIQVGLLGTGVVGSGTFNVLRRNQEEIKRRAGRGIEITMVADLDTARAQAVTGDGVKVTADARAVIANPDIDIVIELIGGYGIARTLVLEAIAAGKHVVTANKALLAVHGTEIFAAASAKGVIVAFEAAVAGGIPIIKALREGLTANRIQWIAGIINGTTNFILSEMRDKGLDPKSDRRQRLDFVKRILVSLHDLRKVSMGDRWRRRRSGYRASAGEFLMPWLAVSIGWQAGHWPRRRWPRPWRTDEALSRATRPPR